MFSKVFTTIFALVFIVGLAWNTNPANAQVVTDGLISYWTFDKVDIADNKVKDVWGGQDATMMGDPQVVTGKVGNALEFNGSSDWLLVSDNINAVKLPKKEITVGAWVYPENFDAWGGFLSCFQDNGGFEKGWGLGAVHNEEGAGPDEFSFAVSTKGADDGDGDLTYFHAGPYDVRKWYHVVGVYDGNTTKLYVNGELVVDSEGQSEDINYPSNAFLVIGIYKDDNENDPFMGKLDEIRLYEKALSEGEVLRNMEAKGLSVDAGGKLSLTWGEIKISGVK